MEENLQAENRGEKPKVDAKGLDKWLRPFARTLRKRANSFLFPIAPNILTVAIVVVSLGTDIIYYSLNNPDKAEDYSKYQEEFPKGLLLDYCQSIGRIKSQLTASPISASDSTIIQACLKMYHGDISAACYRDALALECREVREAPDKRVSYQQYLEKYPKNGFCTKKFQEAIKDCDYLESLIAERSRNCKPFENYLERNDTNGICSELAANYILANCKPTPYDTIPGLTHFCFPKIDGDSCQTLREGFFVGRIQDFCLDTIGHFLAQNCGVPRDSIDCQIALQRRDRKSLLQYLKTYGESGICSDTIRKILNPPISTLPKPVPPPLPGPYPEPIPVGALWITTENSGIKIGNDPYRAQYGLLRSWDQIQQVPPCPKGWRLPTKLEMDYLRLKIYPTNTHEHLTDPNRTSFKWGGRVTNGKLIDTGKIGYYWTSDQIDNGKVWALKIDKTTSPPSASVVPMKKTDKLSCRCVARVKGSNSAFLLQAQQ